MNISIQKKTIFIEINNSSQKTGLRAAHRAQTHFVLPAREKEGCRQDPDAEPQTVRCMEKHCVKQKEELRSM